MKKNLLFAVSVLMFISLFSGCSKSPGWLKDYYGKEITLEGASYSAGTEKGKIKITINNVKYMTKEDLVIEYTAEAITWKSSLDWNFRELTVIAKDKEGIKLETQGSLSNTIKEGEKARNNIYILKTDADNISEITIALFPNSIENNDTKAFVTLKPKK
jgi:hypothetical protein